MFGFAVVVCALWWLCGFAVANCGFVACGQLGFDAGCWPLVFVVCVIAGLGTCFCCLGFNSGLFG